MALHALTHASELLTGAGIARKDGRRSVEADLGRIEDGALVYETTARGAHVVWVGPTTELPRRYARLRKTDLKNRRAVTAGWVDCHTHLVFAGDRSEEFAARCAGATYEEIAQRGGGILSTVRATRAASARELETLALSRAREAYSAGTRTLEIKSGYGLDFETELKCLDVVALLKKKLRGKMTITATFLGAHAFPPDAPRQKYIDEILDRMLPEVARQKVAQACDVFIDRGYFTPDEGERILRRARQLGLAIKLHGDELANTESAALAARMKALSVDHLLQVSDAGVDALARSNTVAVLLPGTAFYLKAAYAPARKLIDAGAAVALATDFNPGTCMCNTLPTIMTLAALYMGMSRAEILAAVTYNGAKALGLQDTKGALTPGRDADFTVLPYAQFEECYYRFSGAAFGPQGAR